jgi:hypothetical protein
MRKQLHIDSGKTTQPDITAMRVLRRHKKKNTMAWGTIIRAWCNSGTPNVESVTANHTTMAMEQSIEPKSSQRSA